MNFFRHISLRGRQENHKDEAPSIVIPPGKAEEAVHWMEMRGDIDLSALTFRADHAQGDKLVESFLDIAIFEVPQGCTSQTCDLTRYGVGKPRDFGSLPFSNLCDNGRLIIDKEIFQGYHTQLMVPMEASMPKRVKHGKYVVRNKNKSYEVMIANCNEGGRTIRISGQVFFDYYDDNDLIDLSFRSEVTLGLIAMCICLLFTCLTIRVRRGTRADWEYERMTAIAAVSHGETAQQNEN